MPPLISADALTVTYGSVTAVAELDLNVYAGEVVGLLGSNGAGKSSTLRTIAGVNPHTSGTLLVGGHDMSTAKGADLARTLVGFCPDVGGLIRQSTVREHVALALAFRNTTHLWPQALDLLEQFNLTDVIDQVTAGFSHGMSRRLSVVLAAITAERVLILDEPFDGVDPLGVEATLAVMRQAAACEVAVVVSTHLLDLVVASCDRVEVMVKGRNVDQGSAADFAGEPGRLRYTDLLRGTPVGG